MTNPPARRTVRFSPAANPPQPAPAIPPPFAAAPAALAPFLSSLDRSNVYITHIDRHPSFLKRRVFLVPVALNLAILLLLLWRAYAITPWYASIVASSLGHANESTVPVKQRAWRELALIVVKRAGAFLLDFVLVRVVWPWPVGFFLERPESPVSWRLRTGFRDSEVVVRASRGWGARDLVRGQKRGEDSPFFKVRVLPAIERAWMRKTGYLMMGKDWDLDFAGMVRATGLVDEGVVEMQRFEKSVFVWVGMGESEEDGEEGEWAVWEVYKLDEGADEEGRGKIVEFKVYRGTWNRCNDVADGT